MKRCGPRCLAERRNQCRELQKLSRCLLTMIEPEGDCSTTAQDWTPTEKCPFCDGSRVSLDDCSEKDPMKMETEIESTTSDSEHYGADCSSRARTEQSTSNSPPENAGYLDSSGGSQPRPSYMPPFSSLYTPPVLPLMTPFVPLPEIANQLYFQSLLQWSASSLLQQQFNSQRSPENLHNTLSEQYLLARKGSALMHGKENGNSEANHLAQHMIPSVSTKSDDKRASHFSSNNDISMLYAGLPKPSYKSETLTQRLTAINNGDEDQPLDLSSRRVLQAATRCAVSSVHSSRDAKKARVTHSAACNKPAPNPSATDERNDSIIGRAKNACGTAVQPSMNKRNYSQADLDAAVRDIRCGRLGTRRASVVYGIPRSTLRNKIYKLEAAEDSRVDGGGGRRKHAESLAVVSNDAQIPPDDKSITLHAKIANTNPTEFITTQPEMLANAESAVVSKKEPIDPDTNGEMHHSPPVIENKKPLWSPFTRQQSCELKNSGSEEKKNSGSPTNSTGSQSDWKRSRPKRGQYRKYNKDALDEAVRSVRRGEMSVHRAGSFYGVPHSTLEYKVKERNLMRTKRKKATEAIVFDTALHRKIPEEANEVAFDTKSYPRNLPEEMNIAIDTTVPGREHSTSCEGSSPQNSPQQPSTEPAMSGVSTGPAASIAI